MAASYSAALCRGLIEAWTRAAMNRSLRRFRSIPRLYAAASLKHGAPSFTIENRDERRSIPRLYAAASLKRPETVSGMRKIEVHGQYSAALCRGLIEACSGSLCLFIAVPRRAYSAALCRGLIEARAHLARGLGVFRGSMPRS